MKALQEIKEQIRYIDAEIRALSEEFLLTEAELQEINELQKTKNDLICKMYEIIENNEKDKRWKQ